MSKSIALIFIAAILPMLRPAAAFDIYYVCVGNSNYRTLSRPGVRVFNKIDGGNKSARKVAEYLRRIGAKDGILFRSEENQFVTRDQIFSALKEVIAKARKSPNPLIVYYFIGHGVSEGMGWNHFSVPGDFVGSPKNANVDFLAGAMLYTGDIFDLLKASKLPFILMLDNCYEGDQVDLASTVFSESLRQNMTDIFRVLRFMNEFHEPDTVLYSTRPGTEAPTTEDPTQPDSKIGVGRLARRFLILVDRALHDHNRVTMGDFLEQMKSPTLDRKTPPAVSFALPRDPRAVLISPQQSYATSEPRARLGSGVTRQELSRPAPEPRPKVPTPVTGSPASSLRFTSDAGDWIGGGMAATLTGPGTTISLTEDSQSRLAFRVEGKGEPWDIRFEAPHGEVLVARVYKKATRAPFEEAGEPGFSASSGDRGCNELVANFQITILTRDGQGRLLQFAASFEQWCDGKPKVLRGSLVFNRK